MQAKKSSILFVKVTKSLKAKNQLERAVQILIEEFDKTILPNELEKKELLLYLQNKIVSINRAFYKCSAQELIAHYEHEGSQLFTVGNFLSFMVYECNVVDKRTDPKIQEKPSLQNLKSRSSLFYYFCENMINVFGVNGLIASAYTIASLYAEIAIKQNHSFPILYIKGGPATGKTLIWNFVDKIANFDNTKKPYLIHLTSENICKILEKDELINILTTYTLGLKEKNSIELIKGIYDRVGYQRGNIDSSKKTQEVSFSKIGGVTVVNESSISNDYIDPFLLSRMIVLPMNQAFFKNTNHEDNLRYLQNLNFNEIYNVLNEEKDFKYLFVEKKFKDNFIHFRNKLKTYHTAIDGRTADNIATLCAIIMATLYFIEYPFPPLELFNILIDNYYDVQDSNVKKEASND